MRMDRRALSIGWIALSSLAQYAWARASLFVDGEDDRAGVHARELLRGRVLRRALESLGATFIKLGQVMSTRPDIFSPEVISELESLQDRLPVFEGARAIIERELGDRARAFTAIDDAPLAAASVAQVHRAVMVDGEEVAIKVLRPSIRRDAERDAAILRRMAQGLEQVFGSVREARLVEHAEHFLRGVLDQTDLRIEAENYRRFRANFKKIKKVRFPRVYEELSTKDVLTMELVRGAKVHPAMLARHPDLAERLRETFLKMCFEDGLLHADLHPGNFLIEEDGSICIFDVGLAKALSDELLEHYIDFNRCLALGETEDFVAHLRRYHRYVEGTVDWAALARDVDSFTRTFRTLSAGELEFRVLIDHVFAVARRHGIRPVPELTLMMVGLVTAEGIGKQLDPHANSFQAVANFLIPVLARRNMLTPKLMEAAAQLRM